MKISPFYFKKSLTLIFAAIFVAGFALFVINASVPVSAEVSPYAVFFNERTLDHQNNTSIWSYAVYKRPGAPDLSHWVWQPCFSEEELGERFVNATPPADAVGLDGSTGHYGVKWEIGDNFTAGTFIVTITGQPEIDNTGAMAVIKAGQAGDHDHGAQPHFDLVIPGPLCAEEPEPVCGNGILEGNEECDDGNTEDGDGCSANCTIEEPEPYCGDGEVNGDEVCEIGDTQPCRTPEGYNGDQTCSQDCMDWEECQSTEYCGDGIINGGEECDDGNTEDGDVCSANCETECIPEGGSGAVVPGGLDCCEGLIQIGCDEPDQFGNCTGECVGAFYCTNCGDGICGPGENKCNCPEDCEEEPEVLTIKAWKVVCEAEEYLPNWATSGTQTGEPSTIGENTAQDYVAASQEKCWLEAGWDFQWGFNGEVSSPNGSDIGPGGPGWNNFDSSTGVGTPAEVQISDLKGTSRIWVKENLKENYLPFANPPGDSQDNVSAELLCHDDILNYDNYDFINNPQLEETYYCVAFNVLKEEPEPVCGNSILEGDEECDDGNTEDGDGCSAICETELVCNPEEELVINAGFEIPVVVHDKKWDIFKSLEVHGWTVEWVSAEPPYNSYEQPADPYLELQRGVNDWFPQEGFQYAELDSDWAGPDGSLNGEPASAKIYQDISTILGENYQIKFYFSPRPVTDSSNNILEFSWGGEVKATTTAAGGSNTNWSEYNYNFTASGNTTRLQFADLGTSDSLGTFLDNVSVRCQPTPEPECGNGTLDDGEECDDGNTEDGDGCSAICAIEEGAVVINEIMQNPDVVDDVYGEWFELYNATGGSIDLEGCIIQDNSIDSHTISASLIVPASGYAVLARNGDAGQNGGVTADYIYSSFLLANAADEIIIQCNDTEIDRVEYDGGPNFPDPEGASMILDDPAFDNNVGSNWCVSRTPFGDGDLGTPGAQNDSCEIEGSIIVGCKYNDANNNSKIDPGEEKLGGWTIVLEIQNVLDWIDVTSAATQEEGDNQGCYLFEALETGNYRISERLNDQPGWVQTYPSTLSHIISLGEDETVSNIDFANYYEPVCGNSVLDDGEECDDGNTEDGDGCSATCTIEEQPGCEPGETQSCNTGLLGICALGTQTCTELGVWSECVQNEEPTNEVCNDGLDNDCDGSTDCGDGDCASYPACHGGPGPDPLFIFNEKIEKILEDTVAVTWSTSTYATSRVVYDTVSHPTLSDPPNYGYTYSTSEDVNKVKFHRVTITGLTPKTTYFWRPISHKSWPEVLGEELTFTFEEPECEPGETQSCDTGQLGICALGTQTCDQNGFWGECVQDEEPIDEICDDGLDNNCDGDTDCDDSVCVSDPFCIGGGPECTLGETQSCNTGLLGICALGTQTCIQGGFWGECMQNNNPVSEICDNDLDDDCDGYVDEADPNCAGPAPECTDYYKDSDADGYGITDDSKCLTEPSDDYVATQDGDCDDDNPEINPGIIEVCDNQLDDDCDEDIDCDDEDCAEDQICAVEEELEEEAETGLNRFLAAVGNIFGIGNLCWALILLLVILLVVFYLVKKGIKKQDEGLRWIIGIVTVIAVLIALAQKLCWVLIFPIILLIILMVLDYMKKNKEKKSEPTF